MGVLAPHDRAFSHLAQVRIGARFRVDGKGILGFLVQAACRTDVRLEFCILGILCIVAKRVTPYTVLLHACACALLGA